MQPWKVSSVITNWYVDYICVDVFFSKNGGNLLKIDQLENDDYDGVHDYPDDHDHHIQDGDDDFDDVHGEHDHD